MSLGTYSSIAAFLAHYDVLRATHADSTPAANAPHPDDAVRLAEMNGIIAELTAGDRDALGHLPVEAPAFEPYPGLPTRSACHHSAPPGSVP